MAITGGEVVVKITPDVEKLNKALTAIQEAFHQTAEVMADLREALEAIEEEAADEGS